MGKSGKRRAPWWARLAAVAGGVLIVVSGGALVTGQTLINRYAGAVSDESILSPVSTPTRTSDIRGPLNILLTGIDPRDASTAPLADSIIVAHLPADLSTAYLFSLPRDLVVDIPAFEAADFDGERARINSAMAFGSRVGDGKHDPRQGFQLLAKTVTEVTGIKKFDAGAIINFGGFKKIVEAMGGVTMTIDQNVRSEHLQPDGKPRPRKPNCSGCAHPYTGPQKTYKPGTYHLQAWEALDYARQRYELPNSDYDRQRHQQQLLKAMAKQAMSRDVVTDPGKLLKILDAAGDSLTFAGGGHSIVDWTLALKDINVDDMTSIKLPGGGFEINGEYAGERLDPSTEEFFEAVRADRLPAFLLDNPGYVSTGAPTPPKSD